jgi:hypothetical protein
MKLLLSPRYSADSQILWKAAPLHGWQVQRAGWRVYGTPGVTAVYGETMWARIVAEQLDMQLIDPPPSWLTTIPEKYLGRKVQHCMPRQITLPFPLFLKPPDLKRFEARVYLHRPVLDENGAVIASEPIAIAHEARTWILDGHVQAASYYVADPSYIRPDLEEAQRFAEEAVRSCPTPRAVVVDVAWLRTGGWVVIEANPAYASGIYDADPAGVLRVLAAACSPASEET